MLHMSVDTRALERRLSGLASKQVPFAAALAINEVAGEIREAEPQGLSRDLDRPTPFTKKGMFVARATKRRLVGVVGFKRIQAEYLEAQATGGTRRPKRRAIVVPVGVRLNKYGNMPRKSLVRALAKPGTFSGKVNGVAGIYQKKRTKKGGVKLLAVYKSSVRYKPRLKFQPRARDLASRRIAPAITKHLRRAVQTAR